VGFDISNDAKIAKVTELKVRVSKCKLVTLAKYLPIFGELGTATGNDIEGLKAQTEDLYTTLIDIIDSQTSDEMQANWLFVINESVPETKDNAVVLSVLVDALNVQLNKNPELIVQIEETKLYPILSTSQRADIKALLDPIDSFII